MAANQWWWTILSGQQNLSESLTEGIIGNFVTDWIISPLFWPAIKLFGIMEAWKARNSGSNVLTITSTNKLQEAGFNTGIVCNSAARVYKAFSNFYGQNKPNKEHHVYAVLSGEEEMARRLHIKCAMIASGGLSSVWLFDSFKYLREYVLSMFDAQASILKKDVGNLQDIEGVRNLITHFFNFPYIDVHNHPEFFNDMTRFIRNAPSEGSKQIFVGLPLPSIDDIDSANSAADKGLRRWHIIGSYIWQKGGCTKYGDENGALANWEIYSAALDRTFYMEDYGDNEKILVIPPYALIMPRGQEMNIKTARIIAI